MNHQWMPPTVIQDWYTTDKNPCVIRVDDDTSQERDSCLSQKSHPTASCVLRQQDCSSTCSRQKPQRKPGAELRADVLLEQQWPPVLSKIEDFQHSTHHSALQMLFCREGKSTDFTPKNPKQRDRDAPEAEIMEHFTGPPAREFWLLLNNALPSVCPTTPHVQFHIPKHTFCWRASAIISAHN